jgi:Glycosyltransferase family 92
MQHPSRLSPVQVSSPASLNDCLLRNMYRYRYVVVIDFDEVIIPRSYENYSTMLDEIERLSEGNQKPGNGKNRSSLQHHTYTFRNAYFFRQYGRTLRSSDNDSETTESSSNSAMTATLKGRKSKLVFNLVQRHFEFS